MIQIQQERFQQVVQEAFNKTNSTRWQMAIARAKQIAETNPYVELQADDTLIMLSDSNEIYEVTDGRCQNTSGQRCKAFAKGQPCKHRALRRLLIRYNETSH